MPTYNHIHRQQLFHWIGSHIDVRATKEKLTDDLRHEYVQCLKGALQNGLWVKTPRDPDQLGDGSLVKVRRPITCFTEWSLGQSMPHTSRYGRLGLGFPKRFVLMRGGQPITYVRDSNKTDPYTKSLKALAEFFKNDPKAADLPAAKLAKLRAAFDYLSHFNKRIRKGAKPRVTAAPLPSRLLTIRRPPVAKPDPFVRTYGGTLHFLEEREWRIVYDESLEIFFKKGSGTPAPDYYLKFTPGRELFTVVLPDNHTVSLALQDNTIRKRLFPADAPHVTILSLQDIGTF